ncbi:zinc finger AN1 domain-containing stress-associated protein 15-like [Phragmites australis]|uniref:zinc finger AN1 domain-containing stress-associated protein 15-like n=1 Tax=Phragmites australis TaxID=29695 RepID=UPI002D796AAB|nr:zinc finger AN1 domain-containing stress-associated protein 15-like [Phragmites australis]
MAQESCDLNKDEAEILKPSSSSSPSPSPTIAAPPPPPTTAQIPEPLPPQSPPTPPSAAAVAAQFLPKPCGDVPIEASKKRKLADATATDAEALLVVAPAEPLSPVLFVNRCNVCRKRVGLSGFKCRCGELFCPRHRHSETHNCSFDYKTAGREEISRANPVIRAAKIIKI